MFFIKSLYCRTFQTAFRMALPFLPYREPQIVKSCEEIGKILSKEKATSVLVVTDKGIVNSGLINPIEAVLKTNNVPYFVYVTHHKYAIMSFPLIPHYAVLDASVTYSLPPHLTASTGMDALTHAVEAYIGRSTTKETRALALEACKLVFDNVYTAYSDGKNHIARENMLHAAYKAGIAFSKSYVGYIHAVAHSLGGLYGTAHGLANTVIMPYILEAYGKSVYKKLYKLAVHANICSKDDSYEAGAKKFIEAIKKLNENMGISDKLEGIKKEDVLFLSKHAEKEANPLYPVPKLMTRKELEEIYYKVADWSK